MDFMQIFDVIIGCLGLYMIIAGIRSQKAGEIDKIFVPDEDKVRCRNMKGFTKYLVPKVYVFGGVSFVFGVLSFINDRFTNLGGYVNAAMYIAFIVAWVWFSFSIKKGREKFF